MIANIHHIFTLLGAMRIALRLWCENQLASNFTDETVRPVRFHSSCIPLIMTTVADTTFMYRLLSTVENGFTDMIRNMKALCTESRPCAASIDTSSDSHRSPSYAAAAVFEHANERSPATPLETSGEFWVPTASASTPLTPVTNTDTGQSYERDCDSLGVTSPDSFGTSSGGAAAAAQLRSEAAADVALTPGPKAKREADNVLRQGSMTIDALSAYDMSKPLPPTLIDTWHPSLLDFPFEVGETQVAGGMFALARIVTRLKVTVFRLF